MMNDIQIAKAIFLNAVKSFVSEEVLNTLEFPDCGAISDVFNKTAPMLNLTEDQLQAVAVEITWATVAHMTPPGEVWVAAETSPRLDTVKIKDLLDQASGGEVVMYQSVAYRPGLGQALKAVDAMLLSHGEPPTLTYMSCIPPVEEGQFDPDWEENTIPFCTFSLPVEYKERAEEILKTYGLTVGQEGAGVSAVIGPKMIMALQINPDLLDEDNKEVLGMCQVTDIRGPGIYQISGKYDKKDAKG